MPDDVRTTTSAGTDATTWAVLSDLDGTLVDTEDSWLDAVDIVGSAWRLGTREQRRALAWGATLEQAAATLSSWSEGDRSATEVAQALENLVLPGLRSGSRWLAGAESLLRGLADSDARLGLVTSSPRRWVDEISRAVDLSAFDVVVTADDVEHTKPDAAPYRRAAQLLDVPLARCIVLEDSPLGLQAAVSAGCRVLAVGSPTHRRDTPAEAEPVAALTELDPVALRSLVIAPHPPIPQQTTTTGAS